MVEDRSAQRTCRHARDVAIYCQRRSPPPLALNSHAALRANLNALLREARPRLLRLARLNGIAADLAEDVVQETCVEAWRHLEPLHEPERFRSWLDGICRNVCRRQASAIARNAHETHWDSIEDSSEDAADRERANLLDPLAFDPSEELERQDRLILLDRALGYLSPQTRELVELCYLAELPQREVAERLDMSLGALELKLHRARQHLRRVLNSELREDAEAFGLLVREDEAMGWKESRKWCPLCGRYRLRGTFDHRPSGEVIMRLRCPDCSARYGFDLSGTGDIISFAGMRSVLPAMKRAMRAACEHFSTAVHHQKCVTCQAHVEVRVASRHALHMPEDGPAPVMPTLFPHRSFLLVSCPRCGSSMSDLVSGLLLEPIARAFFLDRSHVVIEPDVLASYAGQDALCSRLVDLDSAEQMTIMAHPRTAQVMATLFH